mmetsp:Transcript_22058/g.46461  ORF Transcript_22058/g.46461 Transcript_22058/m.46461 type:complete len:131 (+) Transcript_22058:181-573(+)|eukprot:CAMPEP_0201133926 /NCGR_PEP_ID=MMETSP0850-20130426/50137_1 /ASSEMBLY_ACC=CAM_ASM_000622 /TAXON_ID=183588 /ORGANISM="Pseudo-nitzschia fraudulenta, Strain WWA7" /LENGTH=130 /DNA_ID=CAMNT_0047404687 /DNA_START=487 /DNA_END=879 /DNA_ORIENTATION=+
MNSLKLVLLFLCTFSVHSFVASPSRRRGNLAIFSTVGREVMSDIDIMCLENAADLCSFYEECDIEEREALLNRFADETEIMAERIATMNALVKHLKTGDHQHLDEEEVASFRTKILDLVETEVRGESLSP